MAGEHWKNEGRGAAVVVIMQNGCPVCHRACFCSLGQLMSPRWTASCFGFLNPGRWASLRGNVCVSFEELVCRSKGLTSA